MSSVAKGAGIALAVVTCLAVLALHPSPFARNFAPGSLAPDGAGGRPCRLVLSGGVAGEYPCTFEQEVRGERLSLAVTTPPGARARVSVRAELEDVDGALALAAGTQLRAVVREPEHAGVGYVWTRGRAFASGSPAAGGLSRLRLVVGPGPANPDERPVEVVVELPLPALGALARAR